MSNYDLQVVSDAAELARTAAAYFVEQSRQAVAQINGCAVALAGGSTPKLLYQLLADPREPFRDQVPWKKMFFLFTDERHVPPDHPESNYRMAHEAMLAHVPVKRTQVLRMEGEKENAAEAAQDYEDILDELYGVNTPDLELVLLGLGEDGHTASLFPHSPALKESERPVVAPWVEKLNAYRITLTLPVLNNAASVMFLVSGVAKASILKEVLQTDPDPDRYPAQAVKPTSGNLIWLVDEAAASLLK